MCHRSENMTFPHARRSHGDHIGGILNKLPATQALNLHANGHRETVQLEGGKRFLAWQARLGKQTFYALLAPPLTL